MIKMIYPISISVIDIHTHYMQLIFLYISEKLRLVEQKINIEIDIAKALFILQLQQYKMNLFAEKWPIQSTDTII